VHRRTSARFADFLDGIESSLRIGEEETVGEKVSQG